MIALLTAAPLVSVFTPARAQFDEKSVPANFAVTLHVDAKSGKDAANAGTSEAAPLATVAEAMRRATSSAEGRPNYLAKGQSVRIRVKPGTYYGALPRVAGTEDENSPQTTAWFVLEGTDPQNPPVISGFKSWGGRTWNRTDTPEAVLVGSLHNEAAFSRIFYSCLNRVEGWEARDNVYWNPHGDASAFTYVDGPIKTVGFERYMLHAREPGSVWRNPASAQAAPTVKVRGEEKGEVVHYSAEASRDVKQFDWLFTNGTSATTKTGELRKDFFVGGEVQGAVIVTDAQGARSAALFEHNLKLTGPEPAVVPVTSVKASKTTEGKPESAIDNDPATSWRVDGLGNTIDFELSKPARLGQVQLYVDRSNHANRHQYFDVQVSSDGQQWTTARENPVVNTVESWTKERKSGYQAINFEPVSNVRYVRLVGRGNSNPGSKNWSAIHDVQFMSNVGP